RSTTTTTLQVRIARLAGKLVLRTRNGGLRILRLATPAPPVGPVRGQRGPGRGPQGASTGRSRLAHAPVCKWLAGRVGRRRPRDWSGVSGERKCPRDDGAGLRIWRADVRRRGHLRHCRLLEGGQADASMTMSRQLSRRRERLGAHRFEFQPLLDYRCRVEFLRRPLTVQLHPGEGFDPLAHRGRVAGRWRRHVPEPDKTVLASGDDQITAGVESSGRDVGRVLNGWAELMPRGHIPKPQAFVRARGRGGPAIGADEY